MFKSEARSEPSSPDRPPPSSWRAGLGSSGARSSVYLSLPTGEQTPGESKSLLYDVSPETDVAEQRPDTKEGRRRSKAVRDAPHGDMWDPLQWRDDEAELADESCLLRLMESGWFQVMTASIVLINIVTVVLELNKPSMRDVLFIPDSITLCFYICELLGRMIALKHRFLFGESCQVLWNVLDLVVVVAGILDQWLECVVKVKHGSDLAHYLGVLRLLRIARSFKIIRVLVAADLSWADAPCFQSFIGMVIAFNTLVMGLETDNDWEGWFFIEQILLLIYTFELVVRFKSAGRALFFCGADMGWNLLDSSIVVTSAFDSWLLPLAMLIAKEMAEEREEQESTDTSMSMGEFMTLMRVLKIMRILRIVRLVKSVRPLYKLVMGMLAALQGLVWVLVLTLVTLYAAGILATRLVGQGLVFKGESQVDLHVRNVFNSVPQSMFILFKLMNGAQSDKDAEAIDSLMNRFPLLKFGFVFFLITSSWTLLSILTAVVSENMIHTTSQQDKLLQIQAAEETHKEHVQQLRELFSDMDLDSDGSITKHELETYMKDPEKLQAFTRVCRISASDALEVLEVLSDGTGSVDRDKLIECLTTVGNAVTEKSMVRLECQLSSCNRMSMESESARLERIEALFSVLGRQSAECKERLKMLEVQQVAAQEADAGIQRQLAALDQKTGEAVQGLRDLQGQGVEATVHALDDRVCGLDRKSSEIIGILQDETRSWSENATATN
mmetsp:Transcript_116707/g.371299  ORF Transcript_116707/g.371299 Transcript_116707/m.371299 type:complete len:727 (-) Transcript_116707:332-2512(-)